jgi:hypothetical protein
MILTLNDENGRAVLVTRLDYPRHFIDMHHPDDYKVQSEPIIPEFIVHQAGNHIRLIWRVSFRCAAGYIPISFIVDTGGMNYFYFSEDAVIVLEENSVVVRDDDANNYVRMRVGENVVRASFEDSPAHAKPANLIGLKLIFKLQLQLRANNTFNFLTEVPWIGI